MGFYISELGEIKKKYVQGETAMDGWEGGWRDEGKDEVKSSEKYPSKNP